MEGRHLAGVLATKRRLMPRTRGLQLTPRRHPRPLNARESQHTRTRPDCAAALARHRRWPLEAVLLTHPTRAREGGRRRGDAPSRLHTRLHQLRQPHLLSDRMYRRLATQLEGPVEAARVSGSPPPQAHLSSSRW